MIHIKDKYCFFDKKNLYKPESFYQKKSEIHLKKKKEQPTIIKQVNTIIIKLSNRKRFNKAAKI